MLDGHFVLEGRTLRSAYAACFLGLILTACALNAPTPPTKAIEAPKDFRHMGPWIIANPDDAALRGAWWELFSDPTLNRLEQQAAASSPRLEAAAARLQQAFALATATAAGTQPQLDIGLEGGRYAASGNRPDQPSKRPGNEPYVSGRFRLPLQASYELDLWGRLSLYRQLNDERIAASTAAYRSVLLSLQAELAQRYFALRAAEAERRLLVEAIELRQKSRDIVQARRAQGLASKLDLSRAEAELAATQAEGSAQRRRRDELEHQISVLIGELPEQFHLSVGKLSEPPLIPVGMPAQLLQRRPDVAEAQRQLAARNAEIGLARLAMFPAVRLTAGAGFESSELTDLLRRDSVIWSLGAGLLQPLLDGGRAKAVLERTQAQYVEAFAQYRERLLVAFQEVETTLSALSTLAEQRGQQQVAVDHAATAEQLARARYQSGVLALFDYIETQRARLQTERQLLAIRQLQLLSSVTLVRSLGGSWSLEPPKSTASR